MSNPKKDHTKYFTRIVIRTGIAIFLVIALILGIVSFFIRDRLQQQILHRDAFILEKIASSIYNEGSADLLDVAVQSSNLSGVVGIRIFDPSGQLIQRFPANLYRTSLSKIDLERLNNKGEISDFYSTFDPAQLFDDFSYDEPQGNTAISRILIPLENNKSQTEMIIEYWIDSENLISEFKSIDQTLLILTPAALFLSALMLVATLKLSLNNVRSLALALQKRNEDLELANSNLALSAKTSAIGAISAHLFHDLKNPLAGLKAILNESGKGGEASEEAKFLAERIQKRVNETLQFIQIEGKDYAPELSVNEFAEDLRRKTEEQYSNQKINLEITSDGQSNISGQKIPLLHLIISNLIQNSIDAVKDNRNATAVIKVEIIELDQTLQLTIKDQSGGIPLELKPQLFSPVKSTKQNGSGLGLAISGELARKMSGTLSILDSDNHGTTFLLTTPLINS